MPKPVFSAGTELQGPLPAGRTDSRPRTPIDLESVIGRPSSFDRPNFGLRGLRIALIATISSVIAMAVLALVADLVGTDHGGTHEVVSNVAATIALAARGSASQGPDVVSVLPLNVTLLGFGVLIILLVRLLRRGGHDVTPAEFVGTAIMTTAAFAGLMAIAGVVAHDGHDPNRDTYVRVLIGHTLLNAIAFVLVAQLLAFFCAFPDLLPAAVRRVRDLLAEPAKVMVWLLAGAFVLSFVYGAVQVIAIPHHVSAISQYELTPAMDRRDGFENLLLLSENISSAQLLLAMGGHGFLHVSGSDPTFHQNLHFTLRTFERGITDVSGNGSSVRSHGSSPAYWLFPPLALLLWLTVTIRVRGNRTAAASEPVMIAVWAIIGALSALLVYALTYAHEAETISGFGKPVDVVIRTGYSFGWLLLFWVVWAVVIGAGVGFARKALTRRQPYSEMTTENGGQGVGV